MSKKNEGDYTCKTCVWYKSDNIAKPCLACFGRKRWVKKKVKP